jgi:hypothetical protein
MRIRSDHGREFENFSFEEFCNHHGIQQELFTYLSPIEWCNGMEE